MRIVYMGPNTFYGVRVDLHKQQVEERRASLYDRSRAGRKNFGAKIISREALFGLASSLLENQD